MCVGECECGWVWVGVSVGDVCVHVCVCTMRAVMESAYTNWNDLMCVRT